MDTAQWPQIVVKPMEEIVGTSSGSNNSSSSSKPSSSSCGERKIRPQKEQAVNCPRCNSTNTKFCYYNNYSLSQPRYFCKTCRRYWTEGGSLRNIPVGGGSRKNKRSSSSSSVSSVSVSVSSASANNNGGLAVKKLPDLVPPVPILHHHHHHLHQQQNPSKIHENHHHQDLNLGFSQHQDFKTITELIQVPNYESKDGGNDPHRPSSSSSPPPPSTATHHHLSALELLTGMTAATSSSRGLMSSFIPMPPIPDPNNYSSFPLPEFKPSLNFSLDGIGNNAAYGNHHHLQGMQETTTTSGGGRLFFPFEDLKSTTAPDGCEQDRDNNNPAGESTGGHGFWNGVLGAGGGSW